MKTNLPTFNATTGTSKYKFLSSLALLLMLLISGVSFGQTNIFTYINTTATIPSGFVFTDNIGANGVDQSTYLLLDAASPSDLIVTQNYDLSAYTTATINVQVATFGSGGNNPMKIEFSTDGGSTWNATTYTTATPTSSSYIAGGPIVITQAFTTTTKFRFSNNGASGRGVRIQTFKLDASVAGITSAQSGNWSATTTWVGGVVPVSGSAAIIANGHTVTMDSGTYSTRTATTTVNGGGTLATNVSITNNAAMNINGTFQVNGGGYASGTGFTYAATGSTLVMNHNSGLYGVSAGQVFWPVTNPPQNVTIQGTGAQLNMTVGAIPATGKLTLAAQLAAPTAVTVNGTLQINSGGFLTNNAPTYGASSALTYNTTYTTTDLEFPVSTVKNVNVIGASTVTLNNDKTISGTMAIGANTVNGGKSISAATITMGAGSLVAGNLTTSTSLTCSGNSAISLSGNWAVTGFTKSTSTVNFTGAGSYTTSSSFYNLTNSGGARTIQQNMDVENTLLVSGGSIGVSGGTARTLTMSGAAATININGGAIYGTDAGPSNDLSLVISGTQTTLTGSATVANDDEKKFFNVTVNASKTLVLQRGILCKYGSFNVNGTLQIDANGYIQNFVSYGANAKSPIYGSSSLLKYNSGTNYGRGAEWTAASGTLGTTAGYPNDLQMSGNTALNVPNTAVATDPFSTALGIGGNLTIDAGSAFYMDFGGNSNKSGLITVAKNVVATGNLSLGNASGGDLRLGGNWTKGAGTFAPNNRTVEFNGSAAQTLSGATTFDYLTMNGAGGVTLQASSPVTVNQTLNFTAGKLTLGANNLTVASAGLISGGSSSAYAITAGTGKLVKQGVGNTATTFPIGFTATNYTPITLTNTAGTSDLSVSVKQSISNAVADATKMVTLEWGVNSSAATTATVSPTWVAATPINQGASFTNTGTGEMGNYTTAYTTYPVTLNTTNTSVINLALQSGNNLIVVGNTGAIKCANSPLPISEGFNTSGTAIYPTCWTQQFVSGTANITFQTSSSNPPTTPSEGTRYVYWNSFSYTSGNETRLVSPPLTTTGTTSVDVEFQWMHDAGSSTLTTEGVQVQYSIDGITWINAGAFVQRYDATLTGWNKKTITLPVGAGNQPTIYVGFKFHSTFGNNCSMDAVSIKTTPSCVTPTLTATTNISANSSTINWTAPSPAPANGYNYEIRTSGTAGSGATGLITSGSTAAGIVTANINGLAATTTYSVYVQSNCGGSDTSTWSAVGTFTTSCPIVTSFPYVMGFDGSAPCWTVSSGTSIWGYAASSTDISSPQSGSMFIYKPYTTSTQYLYSPGMDLSAFGTKQAQLNFWIYRHSGTVPADQISFKINTSTTNVGATNLQTFPILTTSAPAVAASGWYNYKIDVPVSWNTAGTVYFVIEGVTTAGNASYDIGLDNFIVEEKPAPISINSSASLPICSGTSTTLTATSSTAYTYTWSPATGLSSTSGSSVTANPTTSTIYTVTGVAGSMSNTQTIAVNVNPTPIATASNGGPFCAGSTIQLTAGPSGLSSYSWSGPNGYSNNIIPITQTVTQNFDTLGTGTTWTDNFTLPGWYLLKGQGNATSPTTAVTSLTAGTGTSQIGAVYNFNNGTLTTDRALGSVASGTIASAGSTAFFYGVKITNTSGVTATSATITYTGEQYGDRELTSQPLTVDYSTNATALSTASGTWNALPTLTFTSLKNTNSGVLDGNAASNRVAGITTTLTGLSIPNNSSIWVRWADLNDSGSDHALAIDDVSIVLSDYDGSTTINNATPAMSGTYTLTTKNTSGCTATATTSVTVNPLPAGTLTNGGSVCAGMQPQLIFTASAGTGPFTLVINGQTYSNIASGVAFTASGTAPTVNTMYTLTSITGQYCSNPSPSTSTTVTVNPNVSAGTVSGTSPLFVGETAVYSSSGDTGGSWSSLDTNVATVDSNTGFVTAVGFGTADIKYTLSSGCGSPVSAIKTLTVTDVTTWNGTTWDHNPPTSAIKAAIAGTYDTATNGNINALNLAVNTGGMLTVAPNGTVSLKNELTNNGGTVTIASEGNLLQDNDNPSPANTGTIKVLRDIKVGAARTQYNYLGSPVAFSSGQTFYSIYPGTTYVLYHNEVNNKFYASSGVNIPGRGLAVKEPTLASLDASNAKVTASYIGVPQNGVINFGIVNGDPADATRGYNLLGNPYPSNIDLVKLYHINDGDADALTETVSSNISPTFYFWDNEVNGDVAQSQQGSTYDGQAYATFNALAGNNGTGTQAATGYSTTGTAGAKRPTNIVKIGQGFMAKSLISSYSLLFKNSIRTESVPANDFLGKVGAKQDDRFWVQMISPAQLTSHIAVVYFGAGKNSFGAEDSESRGGSDELYSIVEAKRLAINGKSSFADADVVALGTKHFASGTYRIALEGKEGVFANGQAIYLKDKQTGIITNLSEGEYSFSANAGESTGRFEIIYLPQTPLATGEVTKHQVVVYRDGSDFVVKADQSITGLQIFDTSGRMLLETKPNAVETRVEGSRLVDGVYLLKIQGKDLMVTKKIMK